jgi:PKD repeat protein
VTGFPDYSSYVGGLVGRNSYRATISDCYALGNVSGAERVGGLLGSQNGNVHRSYYNIDGVLINGGNHVTMWGLFDAQYQDWFSNGFSLDISDYSESLIPTAGRYEIRDVQGLRDLLGFSHVDEYRFYLATDIDLSSAPGLYIPYLRAEFDGDNHTISGLRIDLPFASNVGMFGINAQSSITNVGLEDVNVTGSWYVGGLAGSSFGNVSDSYVIGIVNGSRCVGGLVGRNSDPLTSCYTKATVTGISYHVGTGGTGGLVGHNYDGPISKCYATGNVTGGNEVGGLIGSNGGNVSDCYATGRVNGSKYVGGLVGRMSGGMVSESFWDRESSGLDSSDGGKGRTTAEMKNRSTFSDAGWDFDNIWLIIENVTYPLLQWQDRDVPTAHAGPDITVEEDTDVMLNGTGSNDDIGIVNYEWTFNDGNLTTLLGARITYMFEDPGVFVVTLNVTDGAGNWDTDELIVTVRDVTPPRADAGPDQVVDQGTLVSFDGSGSLDNVAVVNFTWTFQDGVPVILHSVSPTYRFDTPGKYKMTLNVSDDVGQWSTDMMNVTVRDISPPVADAGEDIIINQHEVAHFDGSKSTDNVGITNWTWYFEYDGEDKMLIGDIIPFTFYIPGHYTVTLKVLDDESNSASDILIIIVRDIIAPDAHAGEDVEVDQYEEIELDASASTDNVGIVNWTWTFEDVGEPIHLNGKIASHAFIEAGVQEVTLVVTDAAGNNAKASFVVTVQDITPPTAVVGEDIIIGQREEFTLDGAASTDDVGIVNWVWTVEQDERIVVVLVGSVVDSSLKVVGLYTAELRIRDLAGNNATASLAITVQDTQAPVASAGEDISVKPGGTVELDGGTSTDNIGVVSWVWTIKGSDTVIEGPVVNLTFDEAGEYTVKLTVTDAAGNVDDGTVRVVVSDVETSDSGLLIIAVIAISIVVCILGFVLYLRNR